MPVQKLVRLIQTHPQAEIVAISSVSFEGQKISDVYRSYVNINDMICENADDVVEKSRSYLCCFTTWFKPRTSKEML